MIQKLMPKRAFTFTGLQAGETQALTVADMVDVSGLDHATLVVRVDEATVPSAPATLDVKAYPFWPTEQQRAEASSVDGPLGTEFASASITTTSGSGELVSDLFDFSTRGRAPYAVIQIEATQHDTTPATFTLTCAIGVER